MKTDVTQTISGFNTFNNASNVYYGSGANLTGIVQTLPSNVMKTDVTQTISGLNTFNNASNVYYGSGANLTGIVQTLPSNVMKTDATQTISGLNTFNNASNVYNGSTLTCSTSATINGLYIGTNTDLSTNTPEIRMYPNIWMDTINANNMRFINNSTTGTGGFGFYCGSNSAITLAVDNTGLLSNVPIVNNKFTFGRNDGSSFNAIALTGVSANLYPIGYCWEIIGGLTLPVNATDLVSTASIPLPMGVWAISGYIILNKGNGAYVVGSNISALWSVSIAGIKLYPNSSGMRVSIASTSTTLQHVIPIGTVNVVVTTANAVQTLTRNVTMTCGTTTSWQVSFTGVKIA